jgi:hypothetical protein
MTLSAILIISSAVLFVCLMRRAFRDAKNEARRDAVRGQGAPQARLHRKRHNESTARTAWWES